MRPESWSAADATPGRAVAASLQQWSDQPSKFPPVVVELDTRVRDGERPKANEVTVIRARLEPWPSPVDVVKVECRWYRDNLYDRSERESLRSAAKVVPGTYTTNGAYECEVEKQLANSVIRYQVLVELEGGVKQRSPRPSSPYAWHAFFVPPELSPTDASIYHVFISGRSWRQLGVNAAGGRVAADGCTLNDAWNAEESVVLVFNVINFYLFFSCLFLCLFICWFILFVLFVLFVCIVLFVCLLCLFVVFGCLLCLFVCFVCFFCLFLFVFVVCFVLLADMIFNQSSQFCLFSLGGGFA